MRIALKKQINYVMIYGYDKNTISEDGLKQMSEISLAISPEGLRQLAAFLSLSADELEGATSDHWHIHSPSELSKEFGCELVVLNGKIRKGL